MSHQRPTSLGEVPHVYPTEITAVAPYRSRLDHLLRRSSLLAGRPASRRRPDVDRRHRSDRNPHPTRMVVARYSPRLLVRGGMS